MSTPIRDVEAPLSLIQPAQVWKPMEHPKRLILLGPPGSGKGTQAAFLANRFRLPHISTGEMLRQAIAGKTSLGIQAHAYVASGELVPDALMMALVEERLTEPDTRTGWILDGFPRTLLQAQMLDGLLERLRQPCDLVIQFEVSTALLIERMRQRGRQDDSDATMIKRLDIYHQKTAPVIDFYRLRQCLYPINGNLAAEAINRILEVSLISID